MQEVKVDWLKVDFPDELKKIQKHLQDSRKSKLIEAQNYGYCNSASLHKGELLRLQGELQKKISSGERDFEILDEKGIKFYHTSFPISYQGKLVNYNLYLRNDPRKNEIDIPFSGELVVDKAIVLNSTGDFQCEGKGVLANHVFNEFFTYLGATIMEDPEAICDEENRYTFINIVEGEESKIEQNGISCYTFHVSDCEILEVTEKFITEALSII